MVALGAAVQAAVLQGEVSDVLLLDVTPLSLVVETFGGLMTKLIERNTTIPTRRSETFTTAEDNQAAVDVVVLQGERVRAADNRVLGRLRLENIPPAPGAVPQIEVTFDIDANGILHVSAKDRATGAEQKITISGSGTLDEAEVQRMVADAERHRADDARLREAVEARNTLDSVAYQLERRLAALGDQVAVHDKDRAEMLIADARQAVKNEAPLDRVRSLTADLQQMLRGMAAAGSTTTGASESRPTSGKPAGGDDVIDADYTPAS